MSDRLAGKRIVLLIEEGFAAREVAEPIGVLGAAGAEVIVAAPSIKAAYRDKTGTTLVPATLAVGSARMKDLDAIVIPGGHAPDRIRMRHAAIDLVSDAMTLGKPVAAIGHGPQVLITANVLRGRTLTCWPSIAVDVKNAGGRYVDRPVVRDNNLVTSRKGDDLPVFLDALIDALTGVPAPAWR